MARGTEHSCVSRMDDNVGLLDVTADNVEYITENIPNCIHHFMFCRQRKPYIMLVWNTHYISVVMWYKCFLHSFINNTQGWKVGIGWIYYVLLIEMHISPLPRVTVIDAYIMHDRNSRANNNAATTSCCMNDDLFVSSVFLYTGSITSALQGGGNVLIPTDTAGRVLELIILLEEHWSKNK